ncbi:MAG: PhzF family phenazine biosynthesis protein [Gordonia sp. (in: high G+C Gram-positive bacteria)]|jgi:PhzF family phenazine biosynthesis protein|nr:PhzF family phenazine biosynthesis protein [Gordonia sp. (in: high G+C Gram-positive bacteria)]
MTPRTRPFAQVDVFTDTPTLGNPVAVVFNADDLSDDQMAAFARWTNLSETTFVLRPTDPAADYRLRIFTTTGELPFAGHPTLGSAHAWRERGGVSRREHIVQECGIGLVDIKEEAGRLAFAAPSLTRSGPVEPEVLTAICRGLRITPDEVVAAEWIVNGPQWIGVVLHDGDAVLRLDPDMGALGDLDVGVIGAWPEELARDRGADVEVRAFVPGDGVPEDPVTGSLNAGFAVWLRGTGLLPASYVAAQGTVLRRSGRVHVVDDGTHIWVGGDSVTVGSGAVVL